MSKLIAFVDGSTYSESVIDHARWAAPRLGASVDVVHVIGRRDTASMPVSFSGSLEAEAHQHLLEQLAEHDQQRARLAQERGRLILDAAVQRLADGGSSKAQPRLRTGDLLDAVTELEADAEVLLIGKRGEAADFAKMHLGSNLERVVRTSTKPVLVANRKFRPIRNVLIAFDGGPSAMKAVSRIAQGSLLSDLSLRLITAGKPGPDLIARAEDAAAKLQASGYQVEAITEDGPPDTVIARHAERDDIDLLVMGAYGHSRIRNFIIGSTTAEMIRSVLIPVLLFR